MTDQEIAELLQGVGEPVVVSYERRNEPHVWMVSLESVPMIHTHAETLTDGLLWLAENRDRFAEWKQHHEADEDAADLAREAREFLAWYENRSGDYHEHLGDAYREMARVYRAFVAAVRREAAAQADLDGERVKAEVIEALESWGIDWYGPNAAYKPAQEQARRALSLLRGCRVLAPDNEGGEMAEETRPTTPVKFPLDPGALVADASTVELLTTCMERLRHERDGSASIVARELSIAVTLIEDAIVRSNKAHYQSRGVYAITDAER